MSTCHVAEESILDSEPGPDHQKQTVGKRRTPDDGQQDLPLVDVKLGELRGLQVKVQIRGQHEGFEKRCEVLELEIL